MNDNRWDDDGHWLGPHDVRIFLRHNWPFAAFWYVVVTVIACAMLSDFLDSGLFGVPAGIAAGGALWFAFMFAFSHGWIAEGD